MEYEHFTLDDWRIIRELDREKYASGMGVPLSHLQHKLGFSYRKTFYRCQNLCKWGIIEKKRTSYVSFFPSSSNELWNDVMERYYRVMEA